MPKFRKMPVVIEAEQFWPEIGPWPDGVEDRRLPVVDIHWRCGACGESAYHHGWVQTLEGELIACRGDWIITGVKGERYPCKPDIFEQTYDPVEEGYDE
jgi:hypothetical protein